MGGRISTLWLIVNIFVDLWRSPVEIYGKASPWRGGGEARLPRWGNVNFGISHQPNWATSYQGMNHRLIFGPIDPEGRRPRRYR